MSGNWQRARQPGQKEQRREAILAAAGDLLDSNGLEGTGLNAIARKAGLSKSNIYRYFESREAILMELLLREHRECNTALAKDFGPLAGSNDIAAVAKVFAACLADRSRYCLLIFALAGFLEHNVSTATIVDFKRELLVEAESVVEALAEAVPKLTKDCLFDALLFLFLAASGLWPHSHPSAAAREVLEREEFAVFRIDFETTLAKQAEAVLRGWIAKSDSGC